MTRKLIQKTRIKGTDGFVVCKLIYVVKPENFDSLIKTLKLEGKSYPKDSYYMQDVIKNCYMRYMRKFCTDGFAVAIDSIYPTAEDDYQQKNAIYIAFRSEKELFKFIMKMGARRTRWWKSSLAFTFVGKEDDPFQGRQAGENWNYEDPQDMIL